MWWETAPIVRATSCGVVNNGRLLVLQRSASMDLYPGFWETPGGFVERGESYQEGAVRELEEETGLNGTPVRTFRKLRFRHPLRPKQWVYEHDILIRCDVTRGVHLDAAEHSRFRWITRRDIDALRTWERKRETLRRAFAAGDPRSPA